MEPTKLHLGCGPVHIRGSDWVHIDLEPHDHVDHVHTVRHLPMIKDDAADLVYASHVLEYFDLAEAALVLHEWKRVLRPGGTLRLAVPDLEALLNVYAQTGSVAMIIGPLYGKRRMNTGTAYHKMVYDFPALSFLLRSVGFRAIRLWDWRETEHSHVDDGSQAYYPHMDKENGLLLSLNVEATK